MSDLQDLDMGREFEPELTPTESRRVMMWAGIIVAIFIGIAVVAVSSGLLSGSA